MCEEIVEYLIVYALTFVILAGPAWLAEKFIGPFDPL
jgi:hypothetical protein